MKLFVALGCLIILVSCASQDGSRPITVNNAGIGNTGIGSTYEDMISNITSIIPRITVISNDGGLLIFRKNQLIVVISDKNHGKTRIVKDMIFLSEQFVTTNGIHAGLPVNQLTKILNAPLEIVSSMENNEEIVYPAVFQSGNTAGKEKDIAFGIHLRSNNGGRVGIYDFRDANRKALKVLKTTNFNTNAYVSTIEISESK